MEAICAATSILCDTPGDNLLGTLIFGFIALIHLDAASTITSTDRSFRLLVSSLKLLQK